MTYGYHITARPRNAVSAPMRHILPLMLGKSVLHYGEGKAFLDTQALQDRGYDVSVYEPFGPDPLKWEVKEGALFDTVVSVYVLNSIVPGVRKNVIEHMLMLGNRVIAAVRTDKINGSPYEDGVRTKRGTFQKQFKKDDLEKLGDIIGRGSGYAIVELKH